MSKVVIANLPAYYRVDDVPSFDTWTNRSLVVEIPAGRNTDINGTSAISLRYSGEDYIRLASPRSGLRVRATFLTGDNGGAGGAFRGNRNHNITLASNWIFHLFSKIELKAASETLEIINKPGECMDIVCHLKGLDYRERSGENIGFIPDENTGAIVTRNPVADAADVADPAAATAATIGATANTAATNAVTAVNTALTNENAGYRRRLLKYNYTVDADGTPREVELFIPNTMLFFYCNTYDMVTKFMPFTLELTRKANTDVMNSIFGAANTTIQITLTELTWIVDTYEPKPELALALDKRYEKGPLGVNFLTQDISSVTSDQRVTRINETKFTNPRYVFVACKGTTGAANQNAADANYSLWRHANIQEVRVSLDNKWYPDKAYNTDFDKNYYSHFYDTFANICEIFSGSCGVTPKEFMELYTIYCIDLNDQKDKLPNSITNLAIEITRRTLPANNNTPVNPLNLEIFYLVLDERHYLMDCVKKTCIKV